MSGTHDFAAPPERVFAAVLDPRILLAVIPGCQGVEEVAPGEYLGRIVLRLPGAAGTYRTHVRLVDVREPTAAGLEGRVDGAMGAIAGRADFTLQPAADGGTRLDYAGDGRIDGPLARLDGSIAERLATSLIDQGLTALEARCSTTEDAE
ncbi:MAG TPA: SRPBCC domain-containing protein [Candidatus Limnocylindrales bacterium]|nr:SRPBCC domain-containing protein [Candidatus Limnocylindrales bacterium]